MTKPLDEVLAEAARSLDQLGTRWCLVGGLAVAVRAEPRFTRDIDLAVSVANNEVAEGVVRGLRALGYEVTATLEHDVTGRLASVRFQPPGEEPEAVVLDLLFASSGIEPEIVDASDELEVVPGLYVRVARGGHLLALKLLSADEDRPQDLADIRVLTRLVAPDEVAVARSAVKLIDERGYSRGRDLLRALNEAIPTT